MTAVLSLTERIAELATRYANDPLPVIELEIGELLRDNPAGQLAWVEYTNALGVLDDLSLGRNLAAVLAPWRELHLEEAEAQATAHWLREKADSFDALVMAASRKKVSP